MVNTIKLMTTLALIPARGGSKGIHRKNARTFCGKPLLQWSIDAAFESNCVDRVVVSTDDPEIAQLALHCGADVPFMRPSELATDVSPAIATVMHAIEELPCINDILLLQPTSPLRTAKDIKAIFALRTAASCESAVSLTLCPKHPTWMYSLGTNQLIESILPYSSVSCRQELSPVYVLNGAIYLATKEFLLREKCLFDASTIGYVMPAERSVDIDTSLEWLWAEFLAENRL
jgi:CMP-N,N'-diacetyllegionaminic acid synthase